MLKDKNILVIGAGVMGKAIIKGLLNSINPEKISVLEKNSSLKHSAEKDLNIKAYEFEKAATVIKNADILILCVKPYDIEHCLSQIKKDLNNNTLVISIAAGKSIAFLEKIVPQNPVIRVMPNTASLIGEGMTLICRGNLANDNHVALANHLFQILGRCLEIDEKLINAATGVSGSGPAYIYLIIEAMADGGLMEGLPKKVAIELAAQTCIGAAKMVLETGKHPAQLKDEVMTPAGCTIGGILSLEEGNIRSTMAKAVQEAAKIASKLGS